MATRIFLLGKEKDSWTELSKADFSSAKNNGDIKEGDIVVRSNNVLKVAPVTKLSLTKE